MSKNTNKTEKQTEKDVNCLKIYNLKVINIS